MKYEKPVVKKQDKNEEKKPNIVRFSCTCSGATTHMIM